MLVAQASRTCHFDRKTSDANVKSKTGQDERLTKILMIKPGNTKGGSITVPLTSCLTGLDQSVVQIKTKIVSSHTADSKPVKQEINDTGILPLLVFPD